MDARKVDQFITAHIDYFPSESIYNIKEMLEQTDDSLYPYILSQSYKNPIVVFIISLIFGHLGIDRFFIGQIGLGLFKFITFGGFGLWTICDWFLIWSATRNRNYKKLINCIYD